jgi:NAD(P)-dependent dehydrogenase (short-subunit alcohol dehydrogenase family)
MKEFKEKVAVVTGAASGIGQALAKRFAQAGMKVVLADVEAGALEQAAHEVEASGAAVLAVRTDVSKAIEVERLAHAALEKFGAVHVVCNNAGVVTSGPTWMQTVADWEWVLGVNLWGVIHGVRVFTPVLLSQGVEGHIVNTASMAGLVGMQWLGIYSASKFAVVGLTEALHRELKPHGIGVSVLCPMIVATNINENSVRMRPPELRNEGEALPLPSAAEMKGGTITPEEVARRVVRGIDRKDLYILTHPEQREFLRRRAAKLDAMFEESTW